MSYRSSIVKSVQRGTINLAGLTSATATITSVVTANAVVRHLGYTNTDATAEARYFFARLALTNATTVTATIGIATGAGVVSFEVVEYYPRVILSIQRGTITLAAVTSNTATISAVSARATCDFLGNSTTSANGANTGVTYINLTNTTTVTAHQAVGSDTVIASYQVTDWY